MQNPHPINVAKSLLVKLSRIVDDFAKILDKSLKKTEETSYSYTLSDWICLMFRDSLKQLDYKPTGLDTKWII